MLPLTSKLVHEIYETILIFGFRITIEDNEIAVMNSGRNCKWVARNGYWVTKEKDKHETTF
jgi:hypothetical protein